MKKKFLVLIFGILVLGLLAVSSVSATTLDSQIPLKALSLNPFIFERGDFMTGIAVENSELFSNSSQIEESSKETSTTNNEASLSEVQDKIIERNGTKYVIRDGKEYILSISSSAPPYVEFNPSLPSSVCKTPQHEKIDIIVKGKTRMSYMEWYWCYYFEAGSSHQIKITIWENDFGATDDEIASITKYFPNADDCSGYPFEYTFENIDLSSQAGGLEGSQIEVYVAAEDIDGGDNPSSGDSYIDTLECDCLSGACCNLVSRPYQFKSSGSQPAGYTDYYFCSGTNSPTGTNYVKKRDYYCSGSSSSATYSDSTSDTCGNCEYCTEGDSTCNYYSSSTSCGIKDCDYLDTSCRDYNDINKMCNGLGYCNEYSCNDYTNKPKHTSCGTNNECDGSGNCIYCTSHEYYSCYDNDVYWYNKCDNKEDKKAECGEDFYGSWTEYCDGNDLRKKRNYYNRYCFDSNCKLNIIEQDEKIKTCTYGCIINTAGIAQCKEICYKDSDCGSEGSYDAHCKNGNVYMYYSVPHCASPGQLDSYCYRTEEERVVQYCQYGCTNDQCNIPECTNKCVYGEKRCSGEYKQTCGNYDADVCLEWPPTTDGQGNEHCEFGCENNDCILEIRCYLDCDCPNSFCIWSGDKMCVDENVTDDDGGDVWQYGQSFKRCVNPGTKDAYCTDGPGVQQLRKKIECGHTVCDEGGEPFCWDGKVAKNYNCMYVGCTIGSYTCYQSEGGKFKIIKECQQGCTDGTCNEDFCYDYCGNGQTRCNENYSQICGNYDSDSCLEWPSSSDGSGNVYCGESYCTNWQNYCQDGDVWRNRSCYDLGCSIGNCLNSSRIDKEKLRNCTYGCESNECIGAINPAKIFINPNKTFIDMTGNFTLNMNISTIRKVYSLTLNFRWDNSLFQIINLTNGNFLNKASFISNEINNSQGKLFLIASNFSERGVNGSGNIIIMTFNSSGIGQGILNISSINLFDYNGKIIPVNTTKGEVIINDYPRLILNNPQNNFRTSTNPILDVVIIDYVFEIINVSFYDLNNNLIGKKIINKNDSLNAKNQWTNLNETTSYGWYIKVNDGYITMRFPEEEFWNFTTSIKGDSNNNCKVDIFDLASVGLCYGKIPEGNCQDSDLSGNSLVDIFDLAIVGLNYGRSC